MMEIKKTTLDDAYAIKITVEDDGKEAGRVYVYMLFNDLHQKPFGLIEDLCVKEAYRGKGIGTTLLNEAIVVGKEQGCYKLLCTSRHERLYLHDWYQKHGFKNFGLEFRMDIEEH